MAGRSQEKREKLYCVRCRNKTWHLYRGEQKREDVYVAETGEQLEGGTTWNLMACAGCDSGNLWIRSWFEDEADDDRFYPPRPKRGVIPKRYVALPKELRAVYRESVQAFNEEMWLLCGGGLRALLEGICNDKGMKKGRLVDKIPGLEEWVPKTIVGNLHGFRFIGNDALHLLKKQEKEELALGIEVMEDVMNAIYELEYKSGRLMQILNEAKADAQTVPESIVPSPALLASRKAGGGK